MKTLLYQQGLDRQVVDETSQDKHLRTTLLCKNGLFEKENVIILAVCVHLCRENSAMDFLTKKEATHDSLYKDRT